MDGTAFEDETMSAQLIKKYCEGKSFETKSFSGQASMRAPSAVEEGARLIRAFVEVKDPRVREAIVAFVENLNRNPGR